MIPLTAQLLAVSILTLQRQTAHERGLHLNDSSVWWNGTYDFVIVGGGTAGCILAARLTENPAVSVLLIEAGSSQNVLSEMLPAHFITENTFPYYTVPQEYSALGSANRRISYVRGRVLGGSSTINEADYNRGNPRAYDQWSSVYGAANWTARDVWPFFLRSENNTDPAIVAANPRFHSTSGPVQITSSPYPDPIYLKWIEANNALGWPTVDINGPTQYGIGKFNFDSKFLSILERINLF